MVGRDIGELWPDLPEEDDRPGTRTPGRGDQEEEAEELEHHVIVDEDEDMEGDGERAGKVRRQEDEEEDSEERGYAVRDQAGDVWALESRDLEGDQGGGGGLLATGVGGKGAGGAGAGGGKVNATIRKT